VSAAAGHATRLGPFTARVLGVEPLGGLALVRVELDARTALGQPGQFHMLGNRAGHDYLPRPVGLIQLGDGVGFVVDQASAEADLAGPALEILGPLGTGFDLTETDAETTLLVAAGFGLTVMPAIGRLHTRVRLIAGIRQSDHAPLAHLVPGVTLDVPIIAPDLVTGPLEEALATGRYREVLAAGPSAMGTAVAALCQRYGVRSQIALEAPMACGFGACNGCAVELDGTWKRCCIEGPVVDGARLVA
jgi:dihydroorotate dehydrogenase electron transfer subunit